MSEVTAEQFAALEAKVAALEEKVQTEVDRLYVSVLPEVDEQINRAIHQSYATQDAARATADAVRADVRTAVDALRTTVQSKLTDTVNQLVASSSSAVVAEALAIALKSQVLVVRNANRSDDPKNVIAVRHAGSASRQ